MYSFDNPEPTNHKTRVGRSQKGIRETPSKATIRIRYHFMYIRLDTHRHTHQISKYCRPGSISCPEKPQQTGGRRRGSKGSSCPKSMLSLLLFGTVILPAPQVGHPGPLRVPGQESPPLRKAVGPGVALGFVYPFYWRLWQEDRIETCPSSSMVLSRVGSDVLPPNLLHARLLPRSVGRLGW